MRTQSRAADAMLGAFRLVGLIRNRNEDPAFFHGAVGATERVGADTIENNIDILDHVFKFRRRVIDRLIDSKLLEQILVRRRSEEHTSELQSQSNLVCRLLLEKKKVNGSESCSYAV